MSDVQGKSDVDIREKSDWDEGVDSQKAFDDRHKNIHIPRWLRRTFGIAFYGGAIGLLVIGFKANADADERNAIYKAFFKSNEQALVLVNSDHEVVDWSLGMEKIFGWTYEEIQGKNIDLMVPGNLAHVHSDKFDKAMVAPHEKFIEARTVVIRCDAKTKDDKQIPVRISVRLFTAEKNGGVQRFATAAFDPEGSIDFFNAKTGKRSGAGAINRIKEQAEKIKEEADTIIGHEEADTKKDGSQSKDQEPSESASK
jgi:PAS domain S-box-containing protein